MMTWPGLVGYMTVLWVKALYLTMYQRRSRARDVTGSLPMGAPIGTRRDSRHTPSHARAGCGPGKLTTETDPKKLRGSLGCGWNRTRRVGTCGVEGSP